MASLAPSAVNDAAADLRDPHLAALNPQQRYAVEFGIGANAGQGPLLVIAGAGSGKTDTIAHRVAHLVCKGSDAQRILLLTFSRRAALEMERRAGRILNRVLGTRQGAGAPTLAWAGTFHGIGARLLRLYAERIGLHTSFTVHDRSDSEDLLALSRHELGLAATNSRFPTKSTCLAVYSRAINSQSPVDAVCKAAFPWCAPWEVELKKLFGAYVAAKQAQQVLDYDDLLLYWSHMMADASLAQEVGARFDHVLVDEYQDTNALQASILRAMKPDGRGLTVVGDDAQAIYSFRAATVRNILDYPHHFTLPAQIVTLERSYRSTQPILAASNAVIGLASERFAKNLWTARMSGEKPQLVAVSDAIAQAHCVAERILAYRETGIALKSQAVLFRSSSHSAELELELTRRDIPFVKFGGLQFLQAAHVKDVLCILRWAENPRSRMAGFRVARLVPGVGPATAAKLLDTMQQAPEPFAALAAFSPPAAAADDWQALLSLFGLLRQEGAHWPADLEMVTRWYEPHLQRIYEDAYLRQRDLVQLQQIGSTYPSRERFLTEVTLDPPGATSAEAAAPGLDDDYLILSTIHSAKGQEWKTVHILNVVDGCIPSDLGTGSSEAIEEERRLLYVAMTRAKDHLHLMLPQRFYAHQQAAHGDRHVYAARSRFIPDAIANHFEARAWPVAPASAWGEEGAPSPSLKRLDLAARVRALWA